MGLFDRIFTKKSVAQANGGELFESLTAYRPTFTSWSEQCYESELVRSAINARATAISKLGIEVSGSAQPKLMRLFKSAPNEWQTWGQFLYRLSTILDCQNTAFIVPIFNDYGEKTGVFPVLPSRCELIEYKDVLYLRYTFNNGKTASVEFSECGVMNKFQYQNDFFGEDNRSLDPTLNLIAIQNQGIEEGVKSAATYRFMATSANYSFDEDLKKERERFSRSNFQGEGGGVLLFPNTYTNIQQINSKPFVVDAEQLKIIQNNVYNYFGVNEDVLQNKAYGDSWSAFYEGAVEPFAIQLSDVITKMLYTLRERASGASVTFVSNRLQFMTNAEKLNTTRELLDRGILTINQALDIWNLPHVEDGDRRIIRGEYYDAEAKLNEGDNDDEGNPSI